MKITAIEPFDNVRLGETVERPDRQAEQLIDKGLAKAAIVPHNKMAPVSENKAAPTPAAGEDQPSSASPAAPASPQTTAKRSARGGKRDNTGE